MAEGNIGVREHVATWALGDTVRIDNDPVHCRVTALLIRDRGHQYEISWFSDGQSKTAWIEPWRMSGAEDAVIGFQP